MMETQPAPDPGTSPNRPVRLEQRLAIWRGIGQRLKNMPRMQRPQLIRDFETP
jgi:hypothetical protein